MLTQVPDAMLSSGITGQVGFFGMVTPPTGWIKANGAAVSRTTYAALFAAISTTFGAGDGSTTFNIPDLRGEFPRGFDDGRGVDSGRTIGSFQNQELYSHTHNLTSAPHTGGYQYPSLPVAGNSGYPTNGAGSSMMVFSFNEGQRNIPTGQLLNSTSGGVETRPRNVALLACIKY